MGDFMQWNYDQAEVFDPWASLYSYPPKLHAVHEPSSDAEARAKRSSMANTRVVEACSYNQAPTGHSNPSTDLRADKGNTLPRSRDTLTDPASNTDAKCVSSLSGSPKMSSHSHHCCTQLQQQNTELKGALCTQRQQISELHLQVSSLQREVVTTTASYERLLARVIPSHNSLTRPLSFQPFFRILKFVRAANSHLPTYRREHYVGQFYWTEESFEKERLGVSDVTVLRDEHSGPLSFLVGEDGVVVSTRRQQQFFRFGRILYNTLLRYEMAPGDWHDIDVYALEWFCLAIRVKYTEFRLCDDNWKAEAFGALHYTKWCRPSRTPSRSSSSESETVRAQDAQEAETNAPSRMKEAQLSQRSLDSNLEVRKRKEVTVQVTRPSYLDSDTLAMVGDTPTGAVFDAWGGNTGLVSDFASVHEEKDCLDEFARVAASPPSSSSWFAFTVPNLNQPHAVHIPVEDPPDFLELKAQEQSRVAAASKLAEEKRQQFDVLKKDVAYKAKPRGKEKKQWHVQTRRALDDMISSCLDDFERDKARQIKAKRRATARCHQAERRLQQATSSTKLKEQDEQKAWEQRSDIRQRLVNLVKYVDHVERAYRKEERVLLSLQFSEELATSRSESSKESDAHEQPVEGPHAKKLRLSRMSPDFDSYHAVVMGQRVKEFRKKKAEAARKVEEEKKARVQEKREHEARERSARMEAVLRQRRAAKSSDAQEQPSAKQLRGTERKLERESGTVVSKVAEKSTGAPSVVQKFRPSVFGKPHVQQKWDRTSVVDLQPAPVDERYEAGGSGHKSSEGTMETTPKYRPNMFSGRPKPTAPTQPAERTDTQAEARAKAQMEFQARMKARLEAQAIAAAKRRRELEHTIAPEDARNKGLRTETEQRAPLSNSTIKNEIPGRTDTISTVPGTSGPRRTPGAYSLSTPLPTPDPMAHKHVSGWRLSTTMPRGGVPVARQGTEDSTRDASAAFMRSEKSPRAPLAMASPRVGTQLPTSKLVGNSTNFTSQLGTDNSRNDLFPPTTKTRERGLAANSPVPKPTAAKDTTEAALRQESRFTPVKRWTPSHEVWRPEKM
ncbi:hypothetical protein EDD17DRAFT_1555817 [Pisolithus thermaeus]|nr:hypothetical protein EDD17DRAFT_1555817 [Pisolithus thermaeus]